MPEAASNRQSTWARYVEFVSAHPAWTLGLSAAVFCALGWWQDGLNLDSTTYAIIARNITDHGHWFAPTYTPYLLTRFAEHPPLVMWAQAVIFALFGAADSTARLFGQLCTIGSVVAVFGLVKETVDKRTGIVAGLVLLLTYNFMQIGNSTLLDVPMSFFVLTALWGAARLQKVQKGTPLPIGPVLTVGLSLAAALLTKGVVAGPVFLGAAFVLIVRRDWLAQPRFWIAPALIVVLIGGFLLADQLLAAGNFLHHYFVVQVWRVFLGSGPKKHTAWYEFARHLFKLYQPFVFLLPIGLYLLWRRRLALLYPVLITFLAYAFFYSKAAVLYYHYFPPVYALAAPIAAVALASVVSEKTAGRVLAVFFVLWLATAIGVTAAGLRIHEIRMKPVYDMSAEMNGRLEGKESREGLMVREGMPQYDVIAKTSWYWRSDLLTVPTIEIAADSMASGSRYNYILVETGNLPDSSQLADLGLARLDQQGDLVVLIRSGDEAPAGSEPAP